MLQCKDRAINHLEADLLVVRCDAAAITNIERGTYFSGGRPFHGVVQERNYLHMFGRKAAAITNVFWGTFCGRVEQTQLQPML